eukprot:CAMPEP_0172894414 /NCGR_PEP_ID=MMETSP1075-20121228/150846_1 /TAXON_ID=2916 /ORGANISM="Ceratium fusus, Strain PA161109" /LENGTH=90 /DNA_ID=CAMNT_0013749441 /DNA_START=131 /DNA_END=403 /DNA_ORIENTATION=-
MELKLLKGQPWIHALGKEPPRQRVPISLQAIIPLINVFCINIQHEASNIDCRIRHDGLAKVNDLPPSMFLCIAAMLLELKHLTRVRIALA